jgi:glucokinase
MARNAIENLPKNPDSCLSQIDPCNIDGHAIVEAARSGDRFGQQLLANEADLLGRGFASLIQIFSPDRLVMGGGVSNAFDLLEEGIRSAAKARLMDAFRDVEIWVAAFGGNAGLVGMAAMIEQPYWGGDRVVS